MDVYVLTYVENWAEASSVQIKGVYTSKRAAEAAIRYQKDYYGLDIYDMSIVESTLEN